MTSPQSSEVSRELFLFAASGGELTPIEIRNSMYEILMELYRKHYRLDRFVVDEQYLKDSRRKIDFLWNCNLRRVPKVKLIILSEAPMWGDKQTYFYNPRVQHSQFMYYSDLEGIINNTISSKKELISGLNSLGAIFLDFSPFPLNPSKTALSYRKGKDSRSVQISNSDYKYILEGTYDEFLMPKLKRISMVSEGTDISKIKFCYRYSRVKKNLQKILIPIINNAGFKLSMDSVDISMKGGGVDQIKFRKVIESIAS
jgi:hypothetical protein